MSLPVELDVEDLLSPTSDADRLDHLRDEGLDDRTGLDWVLDRAEELVHHDPAAAQELSELCDLAATPAGLLEVRARAHYLRARVLTERGDLEAGLSLVEQARALWLAGGHATDALRTDLGRMSILDELGRHTQALAVGEALLLAVEQIDAGADDFALGRRIRATALENIGAAYGLTGQHERALDAYAQAEQGYLALGLVDDTARPLGNRGIELLALGRPREAMVELRAAIVLLEGAGDRLYAALCRGHLAQAHQQLGELMRALAVLEAARVVLDELDARAEADRLQLAIAQTYLAVGLLGEARHAASVAAERTARAGMSHDTALAHFVFAQAALGEQDAPAAAEALGRAAAGFDQVDDRQYRARTRLAQAEVMMLRGDRTGAARLSGQAAEELAAGGWLAPLVWARLRQSDLADDPGQAQRRLDEAGTLIRTLGLPALTYQHMLRRARLDRAAGRVDEAEALLTDLVTERGVLSHALSDHALRTAFRSDQTADDELVDLLLRRDGPGDAERARDVSDAAKAQTLRDLAAQSVGSGPRVDTAGSALARAHADLGAGYLALQDAVDVEHRGVLRARVDRLEQDVAVLRLQATTAAPTSSPNRTGTGDGPGDAIAPNTLEFHVLGSDVVVFAGVDGRLTVRRLVGIVPELQLQLDRLDDQWSRFLLGSVFRGRHSALLVRTADELLGRLHTLLIAPVEDLLASTTNRRLHLVPHRLVGQLPLQALHDGQQYLLERFVLTVSPVRPGSAAPSTPEQTLARPLVVAVPDAAAPSVLDEAREVAQQLPGAATLVGAEATSTAVAAALADASLVHVACHGLYRAGNPLFSRLRLADRWVTSAEILRLDLTGTLVVLSACESGQHGRAAEPVGLGWAFLAAGASGVVASQWVVHDAATRTLMGRMYFHLTRGADPAEALQQAQVETAREHPHPFYWAAFTYVEASERSTRSTR